VQKNGRNLPLVATFYLFLQSVKVLTCLSLRLLVYLDGYTVNQGVPGSSPGRGATKIKPFEFSKGFFVFWSEGVERWIAIRRS